MTQEKHRVAVVQMNSTPRVDDNLAAVERLVTQAVRDGAKLVVLPEGFAFLGPDAERKVIEETLDGSGPILSLCQRLARTHGVELILGGFWERTGKDKAFNACVHLDASGKVQAVYRKMHLFDADLSDGSQLRESNVIEPGTEVVVTDTQAGKLGLSVCYDVRFPELYRALVDREAVALAIPAAFTSITGAAHWHVLLRARAIESQCYVLAAAQTGHHYGNRYSYGHALISDPWGAVIAQCSEGEGVAVADIDHAWIAKVRHRLPSLRHRKIR